VLTVNTDFAETEADDRQVNLTRFPLFFPEKRQFFLEGAGVYEVAGLSSSSSNPDLIPFFSRRIGLLEGVEVPILAGVKASGRVGDWNLGLLDVETRSIDATTEAGAPLQVGRQNLLAARVSRNLFTQSWVGVIATHGNPSGTGDNTLLGADLRLATSSFQDGKNLSLDLWMQRTDDALLGDDWAYGGKLDYPNDRWDVALVYKRIGERFSPALGFLPRAGIQKLDLSAQFMPRLGRWGIRQLFLDFDPSWIADLDGRVQNSSLALEPLGVEMESGDQIAWTVTPEYERLAEPFEIGEGVVIKAGSYDWTRYRVDVDTADKRRFEVESGIAWGSFYDGHLFQWDIGMALKPTPHLFVGFTVDKNEVRLPEGSFDTLIYSVILDWSFSPNATWKNLLQYDSESRLFGVQCRFRYTLRPGNDLFVVVNRGWEKREEDGTLLPRFDRGSAKLQYTFRF
jgi:hypothetical protein